MSNPSTNHPSEHHQLTPELLLRAYAAGIFPMAESRDDPVVFWVDPKLRGIIPLDDFHVPRSLRKVVRRHEFEMRCDTAFDLVVENCAKTGKGRKETWINAEIQQAYGDLHKRGFAHSVECWQDGTLVGGLYGVTLGAAFFGESMYSDSRNASKVALVHLVVRLRIGGYRLLDTQFVTDHLLQFGASEVPSNEYQGLLSEAINYQSAFLQNPDPEIYRETLESILTR